MKAKFKESDRYNSKYIIMVGEEEELTDVLTIKDNLTKEEKKIELDNLIDYFNLAKRNEHRALNDCVLTNQVYINLVNFLK